MKISQLKNKKIAILGFGVEGKSSKSFLEKLGINNFEILDKNLQTNYLDDLDRFDIILKSPGISPYNLDKLQKFKGIISSQADILANNFSGKIIGITGTKGKSTISVLTYELLKNMGYNVKLVGNIGKPVLDQIDLLKKQKYDFIVYELSSYMLEGLNLNIFIGFLNNIYDCHLDWHNGRVNYENAKLNIFKHAKHKLAGYELKSILSSRDNFDINGIDFFGLKGKYCYTNNAFYVDENEIIKDKNIALSGVHNKKNIAGVIGIVDLINPDFDREKLKKTLSCFSGLPHRQENIGTYNGITFINDSIASTPESTIAAINTFTSSIGTLFVGNEDSGFNFEELKQTIKKFNIENIVLFPSSGEKLFGDFSQNMDFDLEYDFKDGNFKTKLYKTLSMKKAVNFAYNNTKTGKIVLLSTGAPSFNANGPGIMSWKSYREKGDLFKKYVKSHNL